MFTYRLLKVRFNLPQNEFGYRLVKVIFFLIAPNEFNYRLVKVGKIYINCPKMNLVTD